MVLPDDGSRQTDVLMRTNSDLPSSATNRDDNTGDDDDASAACHGNIVLVVDDDEAVRTVAVRFVSLMGYKTSEAGDGETALSLVADMADRICCVILDMGMPDMDGIAILRRMRQIRADIPVIICSGQPKHDFMRRPQANTVSGYLEKPYQVRQIRDALNAACKTTGH